MTVQELITKFSRYVHRINDVDISQMCGLAEGTNAGTLKTTNDIYYSVFNTHGIKLAATDNITMTACGVQAVSTFCYYLVSVNVSGTITITKGIDNTYALPSTPAANTPIGAIFITTDATHAFTSGTTDLSATGITAAFYDIDTGIALSLINQAQQRLERGVTIVYNGRQRTLQDFSYMKVRAQVDVDSGDTTVVLPFPGYKNFIQVTSADATGLKVPVSKEDKLPLGVDITGRPQSIARIPTVETVFTTDGAPAMEFGLSPAPDQTYMIDALCYQYSPTLDGVIYSDTWLTANAPDILLFGALVEARSYLPADERMGEWEKRHNEAVWTMWTAQEKESVSGDYIGTKFPNPLDRSGLSGISTSKQGIYQFGN